MPIRLNRPHKYGATAVVIDGIRFPSTAEATRYGELKILERAGEIRGLELQPGYDLTTNGVRIGAYRADFKYEKSYRVWKDGSVFENWRTVVEDKKGFRTPLYKWKKRHVEAEYDITIRET